MKKPNILFIIADDLNSWIEPLGRHPNVKTPNINKLAQQGTIFTRAYCPAPYCNASRMAVFTGCLPSTTGVYQNETFWGSVSRRPTFGEHLRQSGYYCFGAGKVFHGTFDYATAGRQRAAIANWRDVENRPALWDEFFPNSPEPMPEGRPLNNMFDFDQFDQVSPWNHLFDWGPLPPDREQEVPDEKTVSVVERFLEAPPVGPFFCAVGLYKPHLPWYVPQRFFDLYPIDSIQLPLIKENDLDDVPEIPRSWVAATSDHKTVTNHNQWRHAVQGYLAAISYCDHLVGRVLAALEASPAAEDTIIVLWSDNGFHLGEKLHWRKFVLWEEATRVPLIIKAPKGENRVAKSDTPVSLIDIFPTLCGMIDLPSLPSIDGTSLLPILQGHEESREAPVLTTWLAGNHSLRSGKWRYTQYRDGSEELYDHASDPNEWTNIAADERNAVITSEMRDWIIRLTQIA